MTACPACKGTGRWPKDASRHLALVVGRKPDPLCKACGGSGKLVDVLLEPPRLPHGVGCPCEECRTF